jgi:hypothetical protein
MDTLAVSINNNTERTLEITDLTLNNCTAATGGLNTGTPIGERKTVADIISVTADGAWSGSMTVHNYLSDQDYSFTFDVDGDLLGYNADPMQDGTLTIDANPAEDNGDHYLLFSIDQP